jgi:aryl-alcohol dehydrogenase-like predicted oxidoreductase
VSDDLLPGRATAEGTAAYARRFPGAAPGHFRAFGDLTVSSIGIGTYLGAADAATDALYESALARAWGLGLNVVDTAIVYRNMRSERAVGRALRAAVAAGTIRRGEVVVASKAGYLPVDAEVAGDARRYIEETFVRPGILSRADLAADCHCLAPRFLDDQLERSRRHLGVATIDVFYLHNPETQLADVRREEFMRRLTAAFEFLERACAEGRIGVYGTATWNGYRLPPDGRDYLPVTAVVGAALEVGGPGHRFRVVQAPYNLAMTEAYGLSNQPIPRGRVPLLEAAAEYGVAVCASASILQGRLAAGLPADLGRHLPGCGTDAQRALQFVRSTPGICTALVGMKRPAHVEEAAALAGMPPAGAEAVRALFVNADG